MLPEIKDAVVRESPREAAQYLRHCTVMPQEGFLIAVELDPETREGIYHGQGSPEGEWIRCFTHDDAVYYKNQLMLDLDSQYGDLPSRISGKPKPPSHRGRLLVTNIITFQRRRLR